MLGLPLKDRAALHTALARVAEAAGSRHAALISDGLYMAATPSWWQLKPRETLLLQYITTHLEPEAQEVDMKARVCGGVDMQARVWGGDK